MQRGRARRGLGHEDQSSSLGGTVAWLTAEHGAGGFGIGRDSGLVAVDRGARARLFGENTGTPVSFTG
ncbi:hypothetical protein M0R45_008783 [Rubus argutus]|uniref:Uncharacterized protein n=1 Tax=Rubus argutus TaxID=59490 RepID=A0AAW1Y429_RUBAR